MMIMFNNVPRFENLTEARKLFGMCKVLHDFSQKARREGILALEDGLDDNTGIYADLHGMLWDYFKMLMRYVVDGCEPEMVADCAKYLVSTTNANNDVLLTMMVISEGVLGIQAGDNPIVLVNKLLSMLGWDGRKECLAYLKSEGVVFDD
jgi:flagellar motor component MotA